MCKVSIIVPIYNVEKYLLRCVNSILGQTYTDFELILVDDGSKDKSGVMCDGLKSQDDRIKVIHQKNKGLSGARNSGLDAAKGEYVAFIDSDDWVDNGYIKYMVETAETYCCDIVSSPFEITHEYKINSNENKKFNVKVMDREKCLKWYLTGAIKSGRNDVSCCTKLYRLNVLKEHRFIEKVNYEDMIFNWNVINSINKYVYTNRVGYYYFYRKESITKSFSNRAFDILEGAEYLKKHHGEYGARYKRLIDQYECKTHYSLCIKMLKAQNVDDELLKQELITVKKDFWKLITSPLSLTRKLVLILIKIFPTRVIIQLNR